MPNEENLKKKGCCTPSLTSSFFFVVVESPGTHALTNINHCGRAG